MFRVGETPKRGQRYVARRGVYAVLPQHGRILITAQRETEYGLDLQLPGGGIDPGESPVSALHREVYEETGWHIANPRYQGAFRRFTYMPEYDLWAEKICLVFEAMPTRRLGPPTEPDHIPMWMHPEDAMLSLGNLGDRAFVAQVMTGQPAARWARSRPPSERAHVKHGAG